MRKHLWTSESVSNGHPDKVADQIADSVLDAYISQSPTSKVACEVLLTKNLAVITGEVSSSANVDLTSIFKKTLNSIGYNSKESGYCADDVVLLPLIKQQSPQISNAVNRSDGEIGAGDQGIMFGYATDEGLPFGFDNYMPITQTLANTIIKSIEQNRGNSLLPDAKSQITVIYHDGIPQYVDTVLVSTQHKKDADINAVRNHVADLINSCIPKLMKKPMKLIINPAGAWTLGGPAADTGLSGRKIVVDAYGADCPVGGGSFSGKDPTKVDRSGAYAARHIAKNIVAAGLAKKCQIQISYAIGIPEPVSINVNTFNTFKKQNDTQLANIISNLISLTPKSIINRFNLRSPIYKATASGGHFGNPEFPWEKLNLVEQFS